jgi:prepilin-type N-terminal cleavage/methylation domain-containing protein
MKKSYGLSLIEVTIVLVIIGLLLSGLLVPLSTRMDEQKVQLTQKRLTEIKEALLGFAIINNRLPCVDTNKDGQEDQNATACTSEGYLPWKDLGVGRYDAWGNPFRYRTEEVFNNLTGINSIPHPESRLRIKNRKDKYFTTKASSTDSRVVAIIFSCGKNGRPDPTAPLPDTIVKTETNDADGKRNTDVFCTNVTSVGAPSKTYIYDTYVEDQFDDILIWLSKNTLIHRLIAAKRWSP